MPKFILLFILASFSANQVSAKKIDLSTTKWICVTNSTYSRAEDTDPVKKQIIDSGTKKSNPAFHQETEVIGEKMASTSLANAFASAVKNCQDCSEIHCKMQK